MERQPLLAEVEYAVFAATNGNSRSELVKLVKEHGADREKLRRILAEWKEQNPRPE